MRLATKGKETKKPVYRQGRVSRAASRRGVKSSERMAATGVQALRRTISVCGAKVVGSERVLK